MGIDKRKKERKKESRVHNMRAGTDIFSFRILHTIQYLVHGLT